MSSFAPPSFEAIRSKILRDIRAQQPDADISSDSDHYVRASAEAAAIEGLYQEQAWIKRQIFPDTADPDYLERHAAVRRLTLKAAANAGSSVEISGTVGTTLLAGSTMTHRASGKALATREDAVIGAEGMAHVPVIAMVPGAALNGLAGELALTSPPLGIDTAATLVEPLTGGVYQESHEELLARLLELIRRPPAGGNKYDYRRWAMEVVGVSNAFVYPLRRGLGTVDIVITAADGLPSDLTVENTQAHIDTQRCVTAKNALVFKPTITMTDVLVRIAIDTDVTTLEAAGAQINAAVEEYIAALAPGETAYKSRIEAIVSGIAGIIDRNVVTPASNVVPDITDTVEWIRLGTMTVELMP